VGSPLFLLLLLVVVLLWQLVFAVLCQCVPEACGVHRWLNVTTSTAFQRGSRMHFFECI
jgi:hypothetical protein